MKVKYLIKYLKEYEMTDHNEDMEIRFLIANEEEDDVYLEPHIKAMDYENEADYVQYPFGIRHDNAMGCRCVVGLDMYLTPEKED